MAADALHSQSILVLHRPTPALGMPFAIRESADPAWNNVSLSKGSAPGSYGAGRMRYMKMGNHMFAAGSVNVTPGTNINLFTLPVGYHPAFGTAIVIRPYSGTRVACIAVTTDGSFNLEWVKNTSDGSSYISASIWAECSIDVWLTGA